MTRNCQCWKGHHLERCTEARGREGPKGQPDEQSCSRLVPLCTFLLVSSTSYLLGCSSLEGLLKLSLHPAHPSQVSLSLLQSYFCPRLSPWYNHGLTTLAPSLTLVSFMASSTHMSYPVRCPGSCSSSPLLMSLRSTFSLPVPLLEPWLCLPSLECAFLQ